METSVKITVILCTYNRAKTLAKTLESLVAQTLPQSVPWEILVVDNNSKDETRQIVEEFRHRYPGAIRYMFESQQGLSNARNAGIRDAQGDILAFIDDDETAEAGWLERLTGNLHGGGWAGAGGRVVPEWNCPPPRWWSSDSSFTLGPLAAFAPALEPGDMNMPPVGANMAFRKEMFGKYQGFRTDLGRVGDRLLSNEDIEFGQRLMSAGHRLRYEPLAVTYHPVADSRARKEYFLLWWYNKGRSDVREFGAPPRGMHSLGIPTRLFRDAAVEVARWLLAKRPSQRFICRLKIWTYAGRAVESYCQARDTRHKGKGRCTPSRPTTEDAN